MKTQWESVWEFNTDQFRVSLDLADDYDLDLSWDDDGDVRDRLERGVYVSFVARVAVWHDGEIIGDDILGGCIYENAREFYTAHWKSPADGRNTLAQKARNVAVCHYFPDMVKIACRNAREYLNKPRPQIHKPR